MIYLEPAQVPSHLRSGYTGKKFRVEIVESVTIPAEAGLWSEGSREVYFALDLSTGHRKTVTDLFSAPWDSRQSQKIVLKSGFAIVKETTFQGKDLGLTFYLLPFDAAPLLPPSADDLTETEKRVLAIHRGIKSGYRDEYFNRLGLTKGETEAVRASLIRRGYLNRMGAITTKGKNAAEGVHNWN